MSEVLSTPPGHSTRAHSRGRTEPGREVECRLDADDAVNTSTGDRAVRVARHRHRPGIPQPVTAGAQCHSVMLRVRSFRGRATSAITDPGADRCPRQGSTGHRRAVRGHRPIQPAARGVGLGLRPRSDPRARGSTIRAPGQEEVLPDALVHPWAGLPPAGRGRHVPSVRHGPTQDRLARLHPIVLAIAPPALQPPRPSHNHPGRSSPRSQSQGLGTWLVVTSTTVGLRRPAVRAATLPGIHRIGGRRENRG